VPTTEAYVRFWFVRCLEKGTDIVCFQVTDRNIGSCLLCILPTLIVLFAKGIECSSDQGIILGENGNHGNCEASQQNTNRIREEIGFADLFLYHIL
jgi:hypothetical protein